MAGENIFDVIMVGGGVMGCATAYYLMKNDPQLKVMIIEKDPTYEFSSTVLSDANIRLQFNVKENIQISQYGLKVLLTFADDMAVEDDKPDIAFRQQGNLFLADEAGKGAALMGLETQQNLGCAVEWLSPEEIKERFSLFEVDKLVGGTFGSQDGTMDPYAVLMAYKKKAVALGAGYLAAEVVEILKDGEWVKGVRLASGEEYFAPFIVNGAGASAHGGLLVIDGDAGLRCGISLKGGDIVVGGSVGSFSAFMAQAGRMVICGDAGDALGDSLYEAVLYVKGSIKSLGADAQIEPMTEADLAAVGDLLDAAGMRHDPKDFKRVASARSLYHWNADANQEY